MATLSLQGRRDGTAFIRALVLDYLVEDILQRQSAGRLQYC